MAIIHKTAKGREIDMNKLATQNELTIAVSNVKINARGDELGPGGQIIRNYDNTPAGTVPAQQQAIRETQAKPIQKPQKPSAPVVQTALVQLPTEPSEKTKGK